MSLESAQFIPEMIGTNPENTDPVAEGAAHDRLTKVAVQGSFPAFVGTQATPKSVSLTEDQINQAALKDVAQTILGIWLHEGLLRVDNDVALQALDSGAVARRIAQLSATDLMQFGDGAIDAEQRALAAWDVFVNAVPAGRWVEPDLGSLLVRDRVLSSRKAGYRNPKTIVQSADITVDQDAEGVVFRVTGAGLLFTLDELELGTTFRLLCTAGDTQILKGVLNLLRHMDGDGGMIEETTGVQMQIGSVAEIYYADVITTAYVFGTGLTSI